MSSRIRAHLRGRFAVIAASTILVTGLALARSGRVVHGNTANEAIARSLADSGLEVDASSLVVRASSRETLALRSVTFVGARTGEPPELFHATVRVAGNTVLDRLDVTDVSRTPGAQEEQLVAAGDFAAYLVRARGAVEALVVLDLRREPEEVVRGMRGLDRARNAITNLQETGRLVGLGRRRYALEPASESATLRVESGTFVLALGDDEVRIDPARTEPVAGASRVTYAPEEKVLPHGIAWVVDTVRNLEFVGPEPIAWLENRVYGIKDRVLRLRYRLLGSGSSDDDLAAMPSAAERQRALARIAELGDIGFPPPPVPALEGASAGEGEWLPIVDDPFVGAYPNAAPAFAETSLHVDRERPFAKVYLIAWDTRQVQLRMVSGTREPESAEGRFGTGTIPRAPESLARVVAGFNGGFQAMHGEFGMMANGVVYLPPKPYAATVGVHRDGRVVMGSWLGLPEGARFYTEGAALAQIPADMVDFRQNLTSVVEGDAFNPWQRWYWGAANVNASEQTLVDRSALCITREGFTIYFWGNSMSPEALGDAMRRARCVRGMHLDMNTKHTAFEYYRIAPKDTPLPPLGRALAQLEFEGDFPGVPTFHARARIGVSRMDPQSFPRYLQVEPRDFFYLALRPTLPGPNLANGVRFDVRTLPQTAYPWAFARAETGSATVVRIDASRAVPAPVDATLAVHGTREIAVLDTAGEGSRLLVAIASGAGLAYRVADSAPEGAVVVLRGQPIDRSSTRAIGVDGEGFLVYVEAADGTSLASALAASTVTEAIALTGRLAVGTGSDRITVDGTRSAATGGLRFLERALPYADVLNPTLEPLAYARWGRIQDTRIRYRPDPTAVRRFMRPPS